VKEKERFVSRKRACRMRDFTFTDALRVIVHVNQLFTIDAGTRLTCYVRRSSPLWSHE
jgi:hypothetical protein